MIKFNFHRNPKKIKTYEINTTTGPIFKQILRFAIPLILSSNLQLLYNAVDVMVVGKFAGETALERETALAAVGATGALTNLIVNVFLGLSVGTSVIMSKYYGTGDPNGMYKTTHTAISISFLAGFFVSILGVFTAKPLLQLMLCPPEVIDQSTIYMQIIFAGMIPNLVYNFGAALLRAIGDTRRPLYFLMISGAANLLLNLLFVIPLNMGVAGVALATIIAQTIAMVFVLIALKGGGKYWSLRFKELKIYKSQLIQIAKVGIPAGIQGMMFSISNVIIQSSINSFSSPVMAGSTASGSIEGFIYTSMNSMHQAAVTFASQNLGARKLDRMKKSFHYCMGLVVAIGVTLGVIAMIFGKPLLSLYNSDPTVIDYGYTRLMIISSLYFLCGVMDVFSGQLRGMGYSIAPTVVVICGVCVMRILWIATIFQKFKTIECLFISYPITWGLTSLVYLIFYLFALKKFNKLFNVKNNTSDN